jgi:hypothetical protein
MGVSTDANLSYGWMFEDGQGFPWDGDSEEEWWRDQCGYKASPDCKTWDDHYDCERAFLLANPLPFTMVNYCSDECPMYILAVPGTHQNVSRGYPERVVMTGDTAEAVSRLAAFLEKYNLKGNGPCWWLSSYRG